MYWSGFNFGFYSGSTVSVSLQKLSPSSPFLANLHRLHITPVVCGSGAKKWFDETPVVLSPLVSAHALEACGWKSN